MTTDGKVIRWNSVSYTAQDERLMGMVAMMPGASAAPFSGRGGRRVNNSGLALTVSSTGNGTVTVSAGAGVIYDSGYSTQGAYAFEIPSAIGPISLAARPGAGTSRIDLMVARVYDVDISVGAVREVKIEVVAGTAGASPATPTLPALSLLLGTLTVPNTGTITFTSSTVVTTAAGGILPVATTVERDALVTATIAYRGMVVDNAQTGLLERYNGSAWKQLQEIDDTGWTLLTLGNSWVAFGVPYDAPAYRRFNGETELRGVGKSGAIGAIANALPAGFRPSSAKQFITTAGAGGARIDVSTGGSITVETYLATGSNSFVSLDTIRFQAA